MPQTDTNQPNVIVFFTDQAAVGYLRLTRQPTST